MHEHLGRRIAAQRAKLGWTQQELAQRLAISRVALSHIEGGASLPGERTVVLLSGMFKVEPHELVAGTAYPQAKTERLPLVAARYTEAELQTSLVERDLEWIELGHGLSRSMAEEREARLVALLEATHDRGERERVAGALKALRQAGAGRTGRGCDAPAESN